MHAISFLMFCYKSITAICDVRLQLFLALCLLLLLHLFKQLLSSLGLLEHLSRQRAPRIEKSVSLFQFFVQTFETTSVLALFPITPILQTLPALGPRPPEISTKWFFMAWPHTAMKSIPSGTLIVFTVGNLWESKIKKKAKDKCQQTWLLDLGQTSRDQDQQDQPGVCQRQACVSSSSSRAPPRRPWRGPRAARTWCSPALCGGRSAPCPPNSSSTGQASRGPGRMSREAAKEEMDVPF